MDRRSLKMAKYTKVLALLVGLAAYTPAEAKTVRAGGAAPRAGRSAARTTVTRSPHRPLVTRGRGAIRRGGPGAPGRVASRWRSPIVPFKATSRGARSPSWGRGWGRLPGRVGSFRGWYGRCRWGYCFAPNYIGWSHCTWCVRYRITLCFHPVYRAWFYLSPTYGCYLPYNSYDVAEASGGLPPG
jgi:hypothetical protein